MYDKGRVLSSLFGRNNGLRIVTKNNPSVVRTGVLYQVESDDLTTRCLGELPGRKLVRQPDECTIVWAFTSQEETWKRIDKAECITTALP